MKTFKEFVEINNNNIKNKQIILEMSIAKYIYQELKNKELTKSTKTKIENSVLNLLLFTDDKTMDLKTAIEYNNKMSASAKKFYDKHKEIIDDIIEKINKDINIQRIK